MSYADELPPRPGRRMRWRALGAVALIVLLSAAATLKIGLLQLDQVVDAFNQAGGKNYIQLPDVTPAEAGAPQTIMILGTDGRLGADQGAGSRSDTILLAHLDASKSAITLMSIPRDLKVTIPGFSLPDKINAAYANGGTKLTLKTVQTLLSRPGKPFKINHVVVTNFVGFRDLVNYLGCAYIDVDRRYFNDVGGPGGYATINIQPGYQRLCGNDSLDYVRYRHTDSDLIRGARQQDFIRQLLRGRGVRKKLSYGQRITLARIAGRFTRTDASLSRSKAAILSLLKLGLAVANKPVQQVQFGAGRIRDDGDYLAVSKDAIDETLKQFLNPKTVTVRTERKPKKRKRRKRSSASLPSGLRSVESAGESMAISVKRSLPFPFFYPKYGAGSYDQPEPRVYKIKANGRSYSAYRMVVPLGVVGEFYGIQGMTWRMPTSGKDLAGPPILDGPHETVVRDGRKLLVYYDGKKVRLVAWETKRAVYYVSNTLTRNLSYSQMVAIAASFKKLGS